MLKQGSFILKKFNKFILGGLWGSLAYCINMMTDSLVSGNQLGEVSLQAVSIVYPLFSVVFFFSYLVSPGASIIFGNKIGEFNKKEASRTAGTSIISAIIISTFLVIGLTLIKEPFLNYYECIGELRKEASAYYNWVIIYSAITPTVYSLFYLLINDGVALLLSISNITEISTNVILSVVLSRKFGVSGLGMATCLGAFLGLLIYLLHFTKKSNNIKFQFCLDFNILKQACALSFSNYMYFLFLAIVDIVLNKIIISNCGMEYIPAYSVVNLAFGLCEVFDLLVSGSIGMVTCFIGERNNHDLNIAFKIIHRKAFVIAFILSVLFFFCAPLMPIIYGLESQVTIDASILSLRIMSLTTLGFGINYIINGLSCSVGKPVQSCFISFLNDVFSPLLMAFIFGSLWGFYGIVIGMSLSPYLALGIYALCNIPRKGKNGFPIFVEDFGEEGLSFDIRVSKESITEIRDAVYQELIKRDYDIENIGLLFEEYYARVLEKNPEKSVVSECTLLFVNDKVRIIIRDNGVLFNFVEENNTVESLNAHILNDLLEQTESKNYLQTIALNRNGFVFKKVLDSNVAL